MMNVLERIESLEHQVKMLKDNKEVDIIGLHSQTKLPGSQINEIMNKLEEEGKVSENGET